MARPAPAAQRALQVLDLLVAHPGQPLTLTEIVRRTAMSLGSAHAVLATLETAGYVRRHPSTRTYGLGPALVAAGVVALDTSPGIRHAVQGAAALARSVGTEVVVSAATADEIIFLARAGAASAHGPDLREGERLPLVPPLGAVFLAWADDAEVEAWLARDPGRTPERDRRHRANLELTRQRGYAVAAASDLQRALGDAASDLADVPRHHHLRSDVGDLLAALAAGPYALDALEADRTYDVGVVAAPVFDVDGHVVAALTATGFAPGRSAGEVVAVAEAVRDGAALATRASRGRAPAG
ncbi:MAG: helix-turn-helix domain-containing protein [Acidimicrobiales bacterium]|nr:helix-turn-helix domain-containing protein [Acidimicrobiales bacterium]